MRQLHFDVEFYDDEQRDLILPYDAEGRIATLVAQGLTVDEEEFFINACFKHQKNHEGFKTRDDLKFHVPRIRDSMLSLYFGLEKTVRSRFAGQDNTDKDSTEVCGVGATLSVANSMFGLIEADWEKIDISGKKNLDFSTKASDGSRFIKVEAKGRIVADLDRLAEISDAKRDILDKKAERRPKETRDIFLGVIASFPIVPDRKAKCRLVDPIVENEPVDPRKHKLVARLAYYWRELGIVTGALFLIALANRIQALSLVEDYKSFDKIPLMNGRGNTFEIPQSVFTSRSVAGSDEAFGEVIPLPDGSYYFYGFVRKILSLLIAQRHDAVINFRASNAGNQQRQIVKARLPPDEINATEVDLGELRKVPNSLRLEVEMVGTLTTTASGHVLGVVKPTNSR